MISLKKTIEILKAFLYGSIAYLFGWIISLPFQQIRDNTMLNPRVSLISVGLGGLLLAFLINKGKKEDLFRFSVTAIISYLGVIFINFVGIIIQLDQGPALITVLFKVLIPSIIYSVLIGIQVNGFPSLIHFVVASIISSIPYSLLAIIYSVNNNISLEFESFWMYLSMGAATAVSLKYYSLKIQTIK